jgi:phosphate starvation-inducible PhoH-like protein
MKRNNNNSLDGIDLSSSMVPSMSKEKKPRKTKKQNEKEIMRDFYSMTTMAENKTTTTIWATATASPMLGITAALFTTPKNPNQENLVRVLKDKSKKIVFITGPAGTGKTLFATEVGVQQWISGQVEKLVFTRPNISVDEELGFLPGTLEEKLGPYVRPIYDIFYRFVSPKDVVNMVDDKIVEIAPLGFMRGRTFKNTWIVADEMQNATISQMKMLLTRIGENSQLIITGDLEQSDIGPNNGLKDFLFKWNKTITSVEPSKNISHIEFSHADILREVVVQEILDIYNS